MLLQRYPLRVALAWVWAGALVLGGCAPEEVVPPALPPVVEEVPLHLTLGNPSGATADVLQPDNYLISKHQYALAYNNARGTATWVSWHLNADWLGNAPRCDCFLPDPELPPGFFTAYTWDYSGTGFDRGHLCPSADRDLNDADNAATFLLTNIMPQAPQLNQGIWAELEDYARALVLQGNELYIVAGGYGSGGTGSQGGTTTTLANGAITVPARYWKVLLIMPNDDAPDIPRITSDTRVIAVDIPNTQAASALPWGQYRTSVDAIEASTGLNLFSRIPTTVQNDLEGGVDSGPTE
ncbi:MAG: DNA/RNA non-specific endonuclease [Flavobacteriales bacterium]|nr:DNA/RNA non-specific endonuclease [Flavobacteriales bacterium]